MTVIYVDTLFLLNAIIDYLLLLAAARLAGEPLLRLRFGVGALLGGLYAVAIFLPGLEFLNHPLCRMAFGVLMLLVAYGRSKRLLRQSIIFLALTLSFGGGVFAIGLLGGNTLTLGRGVYYSPLDLKMVLLSGAVCYVVLTMTMGKIGRHTGTEGALLPLRICLGKEQINLTALVDTGNTLTDPATGCPVVVAEGQRLLDLFPLSCQPTIHELEDPVAAIGRLSASPEKLRFQLLPYRAVGVSRGLLLAVRVDEIWLGEQKTSGRLVALSPTPVSDGGGYQALVGEPI